MTNQDQTKGKRIGYVRVSSLDQNTARQLDGIALDKVFTDRASGKDTARPELAACLDYLREGDRLLVHSIDRLARNLMDLRWIVDQLTGKGVSVEFCKENLVFSGEGDSPMSRLMLNLLASFAEFERSLIRERQREGIALAKLAGRYKGRKPVLNERDLDVIKGKVIAGVSKARIAREMGVSRQSLYKYLAEEEKVLTGERPGE